MAFPTHPHHIDAVNALAQRSDARAAAFCRATQQSFLHMATTPAILKVYGAAPMTNRDAWIIMSRFLDLRPVTFREEPAGLFPLWHDLAVRASVSSKVWMDAYLAAFAISAGLQFVTLDKSFRQYKGLELNLL